MKHYTLALFCMMLFSFTFSNEANAQIKKIEYGSLAVDTLDDTETLLFAYPNVTSDIYDLSWQISATNISGTTDIAVVLEGSNCAACSSWSELDTITLNAANTSHLFVKDNFPALRVRAKATGTGTQSVKLENHYYWRRRGR